MAAYAPSIRTTHSSPAVASGMSAATLRRYDKAGTVPAHRDHAGRRVYTEADITRLRMLAGARSETAWLPWVNKKVDALVALLADVDPADREDVARALLERLDEVQS